MFSRARLLLNISLAHKIYIEYERSSASNMILLNSFHKHAAYVAKKMNDLSWSSHFKPLGAHFQGDSTHYGYYAWLGVPWKSIMLKSSSTM